MEMSVSVVLGKDSEEGDAYEPRAPIWESQPEEVVFPGMTEF